MIPVRKALGLSEVSKGFVQHHTGLKARLFLQRRAAQHSTGLGILRVTVMWITNSLMYNGLSVRITTRSHWKHNLFPSACGSHLMLRSFRPPNCPAPHG